MVTLFWSVKRPLKNEKRWMIIGAKLGGAGGALAPPLFLLSPGFALN